MKKQILLPILIVVFFTLSAFALSDAYKENIYQVGKLKPVDSVVKVKVGQQAPAFTLNAVSGKKVSLKDYAG
ncbi:MAG: peroxiredoxin, partial [Deltaproteobacteria bacterium HGW-Deltaproteobacteria-1]